MFTCALIEFHNVDFLDYFQNFISNFVLIMIRKPPPFFLSGNKRRLVSGENLMTLCSADANKNMLKFLAIMRPPKL